MAGLTPMAKVSQSWQRMHRVGREPSLPIGSGSIDAEASTKNAQRH
jgi:hypothetical protein